MSYTVDEKAAIVDRLLFWAAVNPDGDPVLEQRVALANLLLVELKQLEKDSGRVARNS